MCCNFIFVATIGYTQTADTLTKDCPRNSLCSISNLLQIFIIALFQAAGQVLVLGLIQGPLASDIDYYQTGGLAHNFSAYAESGDTLAMDTPEAAALFLFSNHMYIFTLLAFFISQPWRKDFWTNTPFMCMLVIVFGYNVLLCVLPQSRVGYLYLGTITSEKVAWLILQLALAIGLFIYTVQKYILEHIMLYLTRT